MACSQSKTIDGTLGAQRGEPVGDAVGEVEERREKARASEGAPPRPCRASPLRSGSRRLSATVMADPLARATR